MSQSLPRSSRISGRLYRWLSDHVETQNPGEAFIETPFVLSPSKKWVKGSRVPDVMFVQAERLKALADSDPEWEISPLPLAPDLAVEVMSPTDRFATVSKKARGYLKDGVQMVWVIDPERRAIFIYTPDNPQATPLSETINCWVTKLFRGLNWTLQNFLNEKAGRKPDFSPLKNRRCHPERNGVFAFQDNVFYRHHRSVPHRLR